MTAHKLRSMLEILPTMTLMWLDHYNFLLITIPRLVADLAKSILFPLILNPGITDEILVPESILNFDFEISMHSPIVDSIQITLIKCKQVSIFSLPSIMLHTISILMNITVNQNIR